MTYQTGVDDDAAGPIQHPFDEGSTSPRNKLTFLTNLTGAALSLALVAGICVWGYKLMMRDVTGIPIVRAVQGEMRVRPAEPGGELARHQGLSVNAVAAEGGAEAPADRLVLAPQPVALTDEDMPIDEDAVAFVQQAVADHTSDDNDVEESIVDAASAAKAAEAGSVEDPAATATTNNRTSDGLSIDGGPEVLVQAAATSSADIHNAVAAALADEPGLGLSLRPRVRPEGLSETALRVAVDGPDAAVEDIDPATLPTGTRLVQLGAYDTADMARDEWGRFASRFSELMDGKGRVVQEASSGGRAFYRLRAEGFDDLADARRFCAAILADGGDCIPVVTR